MSALLLGLVLVCNGVSKSAERGIQHWSARTSPGWAPPLLSQASKRALQFCRRSRPAAHTQQLKVTAMKEGSPSPLLKLGICGFFFGPAIDALHNQVLLAYRYLPIQWETPLGTAKTSLLIPPILGITYALLGGVFPSVAGRIVGEPSLRSIALPVSQGARAVLAVASTAAIIRMSDFLVQHDVRNGEALAILCLMAAMEWILLDGTVSSLILALTLAFIGPVAEIPFMVAGCWEYINPDYWPLSILGYGQQSGNEWAGLSGLTGPCYFAVTTDAIALGRWFAAESKDAATKR